VDQQPTEQPSPERARPKQNVFDVYKVALDDLHRTRSLAQKFDTFYLTIITLLLTADAYEIATTKFDSWVPVVATSGVACIGLAVTLRWQRGAANLYTITTNRYKWLREAERHPAMRQIGADIFSQEFKQVYRPDVPKKKRVEPSAAQDRLSEQEEERKSRFYSSTLVLQILCVLVFVGVPVVLAVVTSLTLNPSVLQPIISGK